MICACDHCYFLFEIDKLPEQCPDCGKRDVRPVNEQEQAEYLERKQETETL